MATWMAGLLVAIAALAVASPTARGEVVNQSVDYQVDGSGFQGTLAYDTAFSGKRPGVLVAHEEGAMSFGGRRRVGAFAKLGYVALTLDLYGKGVTPGDAKQAAHVAGLDGKDRSAVRARAAAALQTLLKQRDVDPKQIAGVGFGLGGTALLELARTGVDLEGVVLVHSPILPPLADDRAQVQPTFLVLAGEEDPQLPASLTDGFERALRAANVGCTVVRYPGAAHDFTNPRAGKNVKSGSAYDAGADRRASDAIAAYLAEEVPLRDDRKKAAAAAPRAPPAPPAGVPAKALAVLKHVDETLDAMDGYEGGRTFGNFERRLPAADRTGRRVKYQEWDVNPLRPGVNRGPERLVTGSDGSAYYTADHYDTFKRVR